MRHTQNNGWGLPAEGLVIVLIRWGNLQGEKEVTMLWDWNEETKHVLLVKENNTSRVLVCVFSFFVSFFLNQWTIHSNINISKHGLVIYKIQTIRILFGIPHDLHRNQFNFTGIMQEQVKKNPPCSKQALSSRTVARMHFFLKKKEL